MSEAPETITVEFLRESGEPVRLSDLGEDFLEENEIESSRESAPLRIGMAKKISKAGNAFYEYSQNGLPLPDGLSTHIKVAGTIIPFGKTRPSKSGYPTREGLTQVLVGDTIYKVTAYITDSKMPFYVKVVMHKKPNTESNIGKAQRKPRGGSLL